MFTINGKGKSWNDILDTENFYVTESNNPYKANELRSDPKFVEICKDIGNTPKYQYQMLQIILQVDPDVLIHAQKSELSIEKKVMLTHSKLINTFILIFNYLPICRYMKLCNCYCI